MAETHPDALTELIRILREQLVRKDERIATLESMLREASEREASNQRMIADLLRAQAAPPARHERSARAAGNGAARTEAVVRTVPQTEHTSAARSRAVEEPNAVEPEPPAKAPVPEPIRIEPERAKLPQLSSQVKIIADAVVAAAAERQAPEEPAVEEEIEITARFERDELRKGHRETARAKRGFWPWGGSRSR